jgi:hypothetical protein
MANDANLAEVLELARREMPDVPPDVWARLEGVIRLNFATARVYVHARPTVSHLERLAAADAQADTAALSQLLGVSARRVQQLRKQQRK